MPPSNAAAVTVKLADRHVEIDNGILRLTLSVPGGVLTTVAYNGVDNILEILNAEDNRGYWDLVWNNPRGASGIYDRIKGTDFRIVRSDEEQAEVSFTRSWDPSLADQVVPLSIDMRFVVLRGCSGFYTYGIYEHQEGWPAFGLGETRVVFKLRKDKFHYMAVADNRQRVMPMPDDRMPGRCQQLAYPEAVRLTNPINPDLKGEVDDKYQYSCEDKDIRVHGWVAFDPPTGFWQITPSDEFRTGGPLKQNLTSHVGPTTLAMFLSSHYAGYELSPQFGDTEHWKKVLGPMFIYLNSSSDATDPTVLWEDAKLQMQVEVDGWPYNFPVSEDFQKSEQRGRVTGRLLVRDRYIDEEDLYATAAYVGLALPGEAGSWQRECKGYQFWTRADADGSFVIRNVIAGEYNLYAWVPLFIGDYRYDAALVISAGDTVELGDLVFEPLRDGPTLWEIGFPDRLASEFYVPDPDPRYVNRLYLGHPDRFRQYGLWDRYTELYPDSDLVFRVGESNFVTDWFFAQVPRKSGDNTYIPTTWQIKFYLDCVAPGGGVYKFRVALASAALAELQVRFNDGAASPPHFTTGLIGRDNAIARHGIHGLYWLFNIDVRADRLVVGENTIYLTQPRCTGAFQGLMYDYLRLEGPSCESDTRRMSDRN